MFIDELSKSAKAALYERLTTPYGGTLLITWAAFNWRHLLMAFAGDLPVKDRLGQIDGSFNYTNHLIYPALVGFALAFIYPAIAYLPFMWWQKVVSWKRDYRAKLEKERGLNRPGFVGGLIP